MLTKLTTSDTRDSITLLNKYLETANYLVRKEKEVGIAHRWYLRYILKNCAAPSLFYFFNTVGSGYKKADDWIRTTDIWCQKRQPLSKRSNVIQHLLIISCFLLQ